jgi:hypothetical protein
MRHHYSSLSDLSRKLHELHVMQPGFDKRAALLQGYPLGSRVLDLRVVAKTMWQVCGDVVPLCMCVWGGEFWCCFVAVPVVVK